MDVTGMTFIHLTRIRAQARRALALNLHEYGDSVDDITDRSQKEEKIENGLDALESVWSAVDWLFDDYTTHGKSEEVVKLLKMDDEDFEQLEADQLAVQGMLGSRLPGDL